MANLKKVDCGLLPPHSKTIQNKLQRAHYNSFIWRSADSANLGYKLNPLDYGWKYKDGCYDPGWFYGLQYLAQLFGVVEELPEEDEGGDASEFDDGEDSGSNLNWSNDSDCEDV